MKELAKLDKFSAFKQLRKDAEAAKKIHAEKLKLMEAANGSKMTKGGVLVGFLRARAELLLADKSEISLKEFLEIPSGLSIPDGNLLTLGAQNPQQISKTCPGPLYDFKLSKNQLMELKGSTPVPAHWVGH